MVLLHLLNSFDYTAAGRQVSLLAPILQSLTLAARLDVHVAALGRDGPFAEPLRKAGVPVHILGSRLRFDPTAWWRLRRLIAELRPVVVHAWRLPALRAAGPLRAWGGPAFRLVVSEPRRGGRLNALDRQLLRMADTVIASNPAEATALQRIGIRSEHIHELPSAVTSPPKDSPMLDASLPTASKLIMCVGALTPAHGFRDAIWAADLLRYNFPGTRLVIIGDGPERARLGRFATGLNALGSITDFLPARPDAAALLAQADVVWAPSRSECGRQVVLEAQAAGRPVVATALPGLASIITDGQNGFLAPPGSPFEFARATRPLLEDPALAGRIGAAAREAVAHLAPDRVAAEYAALSRALN